MSRLIVVLCVALCASPGSWAGAQDAKEAKPKQRTLGILLYPGFELLDVYGPAEVFGSLGRQIKIVMVAKKAEPVRSTQGPKTVVDYSFADCPHLDLLLVPGGFGTFQVLSDEETLGWLRERAEGKDGDGAAEITMSVCSGSAILAKAGLLDGRRATSNKQYFELAVEQSDQVEWVKQARWVDAGNRVTSSGVSAGIDMALAVVARLYGEETAQRIADGIEHTWHRDADNDPFARFAE